MLQHILCQSSRMIAIAPSIHYESKRFGWRRRRNKSRRALGQRRAMGAEVLKESRREIFEDLEPSEDNYPLYQSFLEKHKLGMILNEAFRLKYYNTLFPALDTMRNTLSDNNTNINISSTPIDTHKMQMQSSEPQILASTINNDSNSDNDDDDLQYDDEEYEEEIEGESFEDDDGYEYEYEYEYDTDEELETDDEENDKK
eukprot:715351_1